MNVEIQPYCCLCYIYMYIYIRICHGGLSLLIL